MITRVPTLCEACTRNHNDGTCSSFPDGIPERIRVFADDHRQSIAGEPPFNLDPQRENLYLLWLDFRGELDAP